MDHDLDSEKPALPAITAARSKGPRTVFRISLGPSPELVRFLEENPGAKLTIRSPGDPGDRESSGGQSRTTHQIAVRCPTCGGAIAVPVPSDVDAGQVERSRLARALAISSAIVVPLTPCVRGTVSP